MNVGIIGSRRRNENTDCDAIAVALEYICKNIDTPHNLVSGGCPKGGDRFAEVLAREYELPIIIHKADWRRFGRGAGFERNTYIARDSDLLIACVAADRKGGTEDTVKKFLRRLQLTETEALKQELLFLV